jgi:hypothetical protein
LQFTSVTATLFVKHAFHVAMYNRNPPTAKWYSFRPAGWVILAALKCSNMNQKTPKKLELKKKTISKLNNDQLSQAEGGSIIFATAICPSRFCATGVCATAVCVSAGCVTAGCVTGGCMTDFTRVGH